MIVLAALSAESGLALAIGALFGLVRGPRRPARAGHHEPRALARFHRRFTDAGPVVAAAVVVVELTVAVLLAALVSPWATAVTVTAAAAVFGNRVVGNRVARRIPPAVRPHRGERAR